MKKSIIFGLTLFNISFVSIFNQLSFVIKNQITTAERIEIKKTFKDCINTFLHHFAIQ
jgi:hypothetical protein